MNELLTIAPVTIYELFGGRYIRFVSDLDICNDGTGPDYNDPSYQSETAYYNHGNFLNADKDKYIVIPPQLRALTEGVVMGCQARLTNLKTGVWHAAVTGEIGPDDITGEAAYCIAKIVNPAISHNVGDDNMIYLYELWPDIPATVNGVEYHLEPA